MKCFEFRIEEALADRQPVPTLPTSILPARDTNHRAPNPRLFVQFVITSLRDQSQILEPWACVDRYAGYASQGNLSGRVETLFLNLDQPNLADRVLELLDEVDRAPLTTRLTSWDQLLRIGAAVGETVLATVLPRVPAVVQAVVNDLALGHQLDSRTITFLAPRLLGRAIEFAARVSEHQASGPLLDVTNAFIRRVPLKERASVLASLMWPLLDLFRRSGNRTAAEQLLQQIQEWWPDPAERGARLIAAEGCLLGFLGETDAAYQRFESLIRALDRGRCGEVPWESRDTCQVGTDVIRGAATLPAARAFALLERFFPALPRMKNTFTTAPYFSRFHLQMAESIVLAFPAVRGI
jgi:hypothetical protein